MSYAHVPGVSDKSGLGRGSFGFGSVADDILRDVFTEVEGRVLNDETLVSTKEVTVNVATLDKIICVVGCWMVVIFIKKINMMP